MCDLNAFPFFKKLKSSPACQPLVPATLTTDLNETPGSRIVFSPGYIPDRKLPLVASGFPQPDGWSHLSLEHSDALALMLLVLCNGLRYCGSSIKHGTKFLDLTKGGEGRKRLTGKELKIV